MVNSSTKMLVLAGGFGTRLQPLTENVPKPLLKIGASPILEIILKQLIDSGFRNFVISTHYKAQMLKDYFGAYTRLVYLAQTNDPEIEQKARDAAERLGLKFELFYTGYGDLGSNIINLGPSPKQQLNEIS